MFSSRGMTGRAQHLEEISCMEGDLEEEGDLPRGGQTAAGRSQAAVTTRAEVMGWRRRGHWGGGGALAVGYPGLCALSSLFLLTPLHWASWGRVWASHWPGSARGQGLGLLHFPLASTTELCPETSLAGLQVKRSKHVTY